MAQRYCTVSDDSGHSYYIPHGFIDRWYQWLETPEEDPRSWDVPDFAVRIDGGTLTFSDPKIV